MKRKLFTLLVTLLVITTTAFANGVRIKNLYYYLFDKEKQTVIVTYESVVKNKTYEYNLGWSISSADIPESVKYKGTTYRVKSIGVNAFQGCTYLKSVTIPNSVTSIQYEAFENCIGLTSVTIPNSVKSIGREAFQGCTYLKSVTIGNSVTSIGTSAFWGCSSLTSVAIPNSVTSIEDYVFYKCSNLTYATIGNSVRSIGKSAFSGCSSLSSVTIPNSVTSIGDDAFYDCKKLTSVTIPNSVTNIGNRAFCGCKGLTSIEIPNSVTNIGNSAFSGCSSLTYIVIPNSVTNIENTAFSGCSSLTAVTIPNSVTNIGTYAFSSCKKLKSVTIPNSVTSIGNSAFSGCTDLSFVLIPNSVTSIGKDVFKDCPKIIILANNSIQISGVPSEQIIRVPEDQLIYYYPFSVFAKEYVEMGINEWQKKGEFERTADWQKRVNEQTRQEKINALISEVQDKYIAFHSKDIVVNPFLGKYDADNEVFAMKDAQYGTMYVAVPLDEAQYFKNNWSKKKLAPQMYMSGDEIKLSSLTISMPNGKQYTYRNTDAVTYNLAEMEYNFDPIEFDLPKSSASQPQQGQQNITTTKVKVGKSDVDTNIPSTKASNPNTFAIIFANEDYKNVASVPFAKNDGSIFQKYCQKTLGIPSSNIHYVENASFNDIRIQLAWLKDVCDAYDGKASVIVYYAGHGIPDEASKSAYLLPVDGDGRYVQSAYKIDEFYQKLGTMNAKSVTVFMDACFSGSKREDGMMASARGVAIKAKSGVPQGKMVVFSAAQGDETAYPNNDEGHGIFTYYLLKKLQETKGDVTLQDLGEYITTNVRQQSIVINGKSQTPCVTPSAEVGTEWQNWKLK